MAGGFSPVGTAIGLLASALEHLYIYIYTYVYTYMYCRDNGLMEAIPCSTTTSGDCIFVRYMVAQQVFGQNI